MKINVVVDFEKDFKAMTLKAIVRYFDIDLNNKRYSYLKELSAYELYFKFLAERKRVPYPTPRNVHISKELLQSPNYSKHKDKLKEIEELFNVGSSVRPFLHDNIKNLFKKNSEKDCLLNDWDIHHLHLGNIQEGANFCNKTKDLLFCRITDTDVYFLQILTHRDGFCDRNLLRILRDNWPKTFDFIELTDICLIGGKKLSDIEYKQARESGILTPLELDGKYYISPNLGVASSRDSSKDVRLAMNKINLLNELQELILKNAKIIYDFIIRCHPRKRKPSKIELRLLHFEDDKLIAKDIFSNTFVEVKIRNGYLEHILITQGQNSLKIPYRIEEIN